MVGVPHHTLKVCINSDRHALAARSCSRFIFVRPPPERFCRILHRHDLRADLQFNLWDCSPDGKPLFVGQFLGNLSILSMATQFPRPAIMPLVGRNRSICGFQEHSGFSSCSSIHSDARCSEQNKTRQPKLILNTVTGTKNTYARITLLATYTYAIIFRQAHPKYYGKQMNAVVPR